MVKKVTTMSIASNCFIFIGQKQMVKKVTTMSIASSWGCGSHLCWRAVSLQQQSYHIGFVFVFVFVSVFVSVCITSHCWICSQEFEVESALVGLWTNLDQKSCVCICVQLIAEVWYTCEHLCQLHLKFLELRQINCVIWTEIFCDKKKKYFVILIITIWTIWTMIWRCATLVSIFTSCILNSSHLVCWTNFFEKRKQQFKWVAPWVHSESCLMWR